MADRSTKQSFSRFTSALGITSNPNRPASATGAAPSSSSTASDFLAGASHLYSFGRVSDVFKSHSHLSTPRPHDGEIGGGFDGSATSKSLVKDVDSQLAALAMSPEGDRVAVAGREVLKVLTVSSNALIDTVNLRVGSRLNLNFSSNDVQWGLAASSNILATAATNGSVVIWDLAMRAPQKIDRVISEHNRAVNRIAFNQGNGSWMLSASQDGSMKLWDLRERGGARLTMLGKSEAVRDVRFNHANAVEFAAAFDNGTVQKWDIRQPRMYERKLSAHNGLALSLDWHPNGKFLVTGGRDKFIKVWDLSSDVRRPRNIITTMAPVARVAWRPGGGKNRMEIASCALVSDNRIHVWDLRRPGVANRVLDEHENVVAGLLWRDENTLWSCSKDRTFRQYDVLMAPQPVDSLSHVAFGWSPLNEFGFCIGSRPKKVFKMSRAGSIAGTEPGADEPLVPRQATGMMHLPGNETEAFIYLAKHYITSTTTFTIPEACEHNAQAAYRVQKYRTSQTWKMIGQAVEWEERTERARIADEANARATLEDARQMGENARQSKPRHPHLEAVRKNSGWETPESQTTARPSPHEPIRILGTKGGELRKPWAPSSLIHKVTEYYAEQADVQMCSSIALLLGERVDIPDTRLEEWQLGYIELLQRYRLFVTVAEVINATKNENVRAPGLTETQLHTGCHRCLKPLLNERTRAGYWYCERCARTLDGCTICRIPVKGQWTLCQSCGHGGHYHCMSEWFKDEGMCPSEGCGHRCLHK
ncbi:WD40 repeat-like protein [Saitoella complicata NRRL Y-17804]|uniref:WD40 repeat-like protein n=1 Tax=Saitoella complicata (strain BCRC 22490 / CBS 7301 / JCM 7358 / NBRC 10748 / NRRL Y-17804) TaxID=698492 RepID=UPI000867BA31|nr:WD40 repeat-like protein [Saitoella complicata NRRL Y-17804]ODQ50237.1 WD40 repeat-like protein [Saitoella complicata NRRL Y-17804]